MSTKTSKPIDIPIIVYEAIETSIPEHADEFSAVMNQVSKVLGVEKHEEIWDAAMDMLDEARRSAFRAGWTARGAV